LIESVRKEIAKTGFPLEIHVLNICSRKNMGRMPNYRYIYKDKPREIDLVAFFQDSRRPRWVRSLHARPAKNLQVTLTFMAIECKKSEKPWVFFSTHMFGRMAFTYFIQYVSALDSLFKKGKSTTLLERIRPRLSKNHYNDYSIPRCVTYCEPFRAPSPHSEIYEAVESVLSYTEHSIETSSKRMFRRGNCFTYCFYPVIVFDGFLFEARVSGDSIRIRKRPHIHLRVWRDEKVLIVDVVQRQYFKKFLDIIELDHTEFANVTSRIQLARTHELAMKKALESA
jgi:hypothetical protein